MGVQRGVSIEQLEFLALSCNHPDLNHDEREARIARAQILYQELTAQGRNPFYALQKINLVQLEARLSPYVLC